MAETITRNGWPDTSMDDGRTLYFIEEKSSEADHLREDQVKKAAQLLRFGISILIKIKIVNGRCIEPPPAYAHVVWADPNGQFYDRGPWDYNFPPKSGQVHRVPRGSDKRKSKPDKPEEDWRRVENAIVAETLTIPQIVEKTGLTPERVLRAIAYRKSNAWFHWFLIKFEYQAGTYRLERPDGVETWTPAEDRKAAVRAQAPHQFI